MDFSFSEEQYTVQSTARKYLANNCNFDSRQKYLALDASGPSAHWQQFCDLGWVGLALPTEVGGYGGSPLDIVVLAQEFGRSLVVEPYLANAILAGTMLSRCGANGVSVALLEKMIIGDSQVSLAYIDSELTECVLEHCDGGYTLCGSKKLVYNGSACDELLVTARLSGDGCGSLILVCVSPTADGVEIERFRTVDGFLAANISFSNVAVNAECVLSDDAELVLAEAIQRGALCICAEAVGIMEALLEKTLEYVKTRRQFGASLSSFQIIQHKLVDIFVEVEQSRSILYRWAIEGKSQPQIWHAAKARISIASRMVGEQAVQLHGGMGISNELDIGHYFKRLTVISILFGDADFHLSSYSHSDSELLCNSIFSLY